jgi:hypothetical protein
MTSPADDDPLPLADACAVYPQARLTVSTLRAESARGRLKVFRLGRRDYTTRRDMQEMIAKCREDDRRHGFTSIRQDGNGSSRTVGTVSALAALRQSVGGRNSS